MPIYEYSCQMCDNKFEKIQKFSDLPIENCPTCSGPVNKLVSLSSFHLKGTGWYSTDYAKTPKSNTETKTEQKGKNNDGGTSN